MPTASKTIRKRGTKRRAVGSSRPDLPYAMRLPDGRTLCVEVPGRWVTADRDGTPAFRPDGAAFLDRVRALFVSTLDRPPSPGYIARLRQAMGLTQTQFGERIGVDKMTVYRWESGRIRPSMAAVKAIEKLRRQTVRRGATLAS